MCVQGTDPEDIETQIIRKPDDAEPLSALAFKIMADKFVGSLTFCRIYRSAPLPSLRLPLFIIRLFNYLITSQAAIAPFSAQIPATP